METFTEKERISLRQFQKDQAEWARKNFGDPHERSYHQPFFGMVEELGELSHAMLKEEQNIRGTFEELEELGRDAVGDLFVFLNDFCTLKGWILEEVIEKTWAHVSTRNWKKDPQRGGTGTDPVQGHKEPQVNE